MEGFGACSAAGSGCLVVLGGMMHCARWRCDS